jgi:filamentous hemagglutinin family protein
MRFVSTFVYHRAVVLASSGAAMMVAISDLQALPQGGSVVRGDAAFTREGNVLTIQQGSPQAILEYQGFSIGAGETVRFVQPGPGASALNRVTGGQASTIAGALQANGNIFLVNPAGVLFTPTAQVNVHGLVASAMNISDEDYMAGRLSFSGGGGSVVNQGAINAAFAYLVGSRVENTGVIEAGAIALAAGENSVVIDEVGGGQIRLVIDGLEQGPEAVAAPEAGYVPATTEAGEVVELPAVEVAAAPQSVPAPRETTSALAVQIRQDPATRGLVFNQGTLIASGLAGGRVDIAGRFAVQDGVIDVTGASGGGTINITANDLVLVTDGSRTTANAGPQGDGGSIIVFSPGTAILEAGSAVSARGGFLAGDGGQAEVSGYQEVQFSGVVDLTAPAGHAGNLLIDPFNVLINNLGPQSGGAFGAGTWTPSAAPSVILVANLLAQLESGNVTITTTGGGAEAGDITLASVLGLDDLVTTATRTLTFQAHNHININAAITQSNPGGNNIINAVNLILTANSDNVGGGNVVLAADVNTGGGSFTASGVDFTQNATRNLDTGGGAVQLTQTGAVSLLGNSITTSGGGVTITGAGDSTLTSSITTSGGNISAILNGAGNDWTVNAGLNAGGGAGTGSVDIRSNGGTLALNISALLTSGGSGLVNLRSAGAMTLAGDISTSGGDVDIRTTAPGNLDINGTALIAALGGDNGGVIDIQSNGGNILLAAGSQIVSGSAGDISISAGGALSDITMAGTVNGGSGGTVVSANRDLNHTGSTTSGGGITQLGADMNFDGVGLGSFGGAITLNGSGVLNLRGGDTTISGVVDTNGNNAQIQARNGMTVSGDVITDGGNVQISASAGGAGNLLITATGLVDARGGANNGIATLSNANGNIINNGEVRSGTAGRLFALAGGATGVFTQNGIYVGGTEALFGTTVRANNGIAVNQPILGTGIVNLQGNFDGLGGGRRHAQRVRQRRRGRDHQRRLRHRQPRREHHRAEQPDRHRQHLRGRGHHRCD